MFSATKFVVAAVIVALSGGFVLTGVLLQRPSEEPLPATVVTASASPEAKASPEATTAPDSSASDALLPGLALVTEEVEPGVLRVVSDGSRELTRAVAAASEMDDGDIVAGLDGSIWVFGRDGFFRIGSERTYGWDEEPTFQGFEPTFQGAEVAPDGTLWRVVGRTLRSFDGEAWTVRRTIRKGDEFIGLVALPDGDIWAAWQGDGDCPTCLRTVVGRLDVDGWTKRVHPFGGKDFGRYRGDAFTVTDDGMAWLGGWFVYDDDRAAQAGLLGLGHGPVCCVPDPMASPPPPGTVLRTADPAASPAPYWSQPAVGSGDPLFGSFAAAHDGILWQNLRGSLGRFADGEWTVYSEPDSARVRLPPDSRRSPSVRMVETAPGDITGGVIAAAPDGSVWLWGGPTPCSGLARFDGASSTRYLRDSCIAAVAVAPDGTVWVQAGTGPPEGVGDGWEGSPVETYVIRPEAAAATE